MWVNQGILSCFIAVNVQIWALHIEQNFGHGPLLVGSPKREVKIYWSKFKIRVKV